jgi:ABC-type cobalamin/Fe3+-siderophores transport system ATPase subunit
MIRLGVALVGLLVLAAPASRLLKPLNRDQGMTVLLVSHDLNLAVEVSDRLVLMADGRLVAVGAPEVGPEESVLAAVFGCEVPVEKKTDHAPALGAAGLAG